MKTDLDHLPPRKIAQLRQIAAFIQQTVDVELIILFGSHARGDWVEDLANGYYSDYDLLVVVASEEVAEDDALWNRITRNVRPMAGRTPVTLLVHDFRFVAAQVRIGQFFFSDIVKEGIILHDSGRNALPQARTLNAIERLQIDEKNFHYWFGSASTFVRGASYFMSAGVRSHAAFMLHQAAERYFDAALLAYTGYKPKTHDLLELAEKTASLHPALEGALPRTAPEDEHIFSLLRRAYVEARYSMDYQVTDEELVIMRERVLDLARRSLKASAVRLEKIMGRDLMGKLPDVPTVDEVETMPPIPATTDPKSLEAWREEVMRLSHERGLREGETRGREEGRQEGLREGEAKGEEKGREVGLREGEAKGLREGEAKGRDEGLREGEARGEAKAILAILRTRGIAVSEEQAARILACQDEALLAGFLERVLSVESAAALWG